MKPSTTVAGVAAVLAVATTACGSPAADRREKPEAGQSPGPSETTSAQQEQITPGAIAVILHEHLGDAVRRVVTFRGDQEAGSIDVMVELRDRTPHNFSVGVFSPRGTAELGPAGSCPPRRQLGGQETRCRTLGDGTTITIGRTRTGFSDDNRNGSMLFGSVVTAEDGGAIAMYESYDPSPALTRAELEDVLTDPRLTWLTDPEVNEAGRAVDVEQVPG